MMKNIEILDRASVAVNLPLGGLKGRMLADAVLFVVGMKSLARNIQEQINNAMDELKSPGFNERFQQYQDKKRENGEHMDKAMEDEIASLNNAYQYVCEKVYGEECTAELPQPPEGLFEMLCENVDAGKMYPTKENKEISGAEILTNYAELFLNE